MRITKVYTRTGDGGETSLASGERVSKGSLRVNAYGDVDELNSVLGFACCKLTDGDILRILNRTQNLLFVLGADLATPQPEPADRRKDSIRRITAEEVGSLEQAIDRFNEALPPLQEFILPGGCEAGGLLHVARSVARRAERTGVRLARLEKVNPQALIYLNRLSDLLFVLARVVNRQNNSPESAADFH